MSRKRFRTLVARAMDSIPAPIRSRMDNVEIVVEDWPSGDDFDAAGLEPGETLFGLYEGTPLVTRGITSDPMLPDKITIFQGPLEESCDSEDEIDEEIRKTVVHEIAHHFGIDEDRLADLGYD